MAVALRRSRSCASIKARCGSHADTDTIADVGGRGGGVCATGSVATPGEFVGHPLLVPADRLAVDPGDALDLALAGSSLQQRPDRCLQMQLQDVHSYPLYREGPKVTSCSAPASRKNRQISAS
jgi:hypothetical protein